MFPIRFSVIVLKSLLWHFGSNQCDQMLKLKGEAIFTKVAQKFSHSNFYQKSDVFLSSPKRLLFSKTFKKRAQSGHTGSNSHTREGASKCAEKKSILLPSFERNVIKSLFPQKLLNYSILFATQLASMEAKSTAESLIETSLFEPVFQ